MLAINFLKTAKCVLPKKNVAKAAESVFRGLKKKACAEINIVGNGEIKKINREYRGKNAITDVLSFAWEEDEKIKSDFWGQIYICYPRIKKQAESFGVSEQEEFVRILTHGILHLLGYDHIAKKQADKMFALQESFVKKIKI
ncbi:MAG: rRNA maturation RNase YbeY [Patescibacteria group bacterium]|nr:rRNA maturation RNase YbeY [Patescibacteria group bacterium]